MNRSIPTPAIAARSAVPPAPRPTAVLATVAVLALALAGTATAAEGERCAHYDPLRQAFFGTTHLHTGFSFDAAIRFVPSTPREAYAFAKGKQKLPGVDSWGLVRREYEIDRPLDWGAVTDHAEHFGEIGICKSEHFGLDPEPAAKYSLDCQLLRGFYYAPGETTGPGDEGVLVPAEGGTRTPPGFKRTQASNAFTILVAPGLAPGAKNIRLPLCESGLADCDASELSVWQSIQSAAHEAYERCEFTSFVAYEAASTPSGTNWHRNVIFRNEHVIERPISAIDMAAVENPDPDTVPPEILRAPAVEKLWNGLREQCLEAGTGCDVLTIPHNSNLGGGIWAGTRALVPPLFFDPRGQTVEAQRQDAADRQSMEPLVEIFQDKGSSECRFDPRFDQGVGTSDELCDFEILDTTTLLGASGVGSGGGSGGVPPSAFNERAFVRNVLKDGLRYQQQLGVNPFKLGIVAASDSHIGAMGWHPENATYGGHEGIEDAIPIATPNNMQNNSGGHSVAWAEENSRDAIFDALKRRETYGTSGTRPIVRFFGGWGDGFAARCSRPQELAKSGYEHGVPMGGDLDAAPSVAQGGRPRFLFAAWKDDFIATPLQRVQVVKGWLDAAGDTHEQVIDVAGGPNDASVDPETCAPVGAGHDALCGVWEDTGFDPAQAAFYYLRVLENPVCRYSTHICRETYGVDPLSPSCGDQLLALQNGTPEQKEKALQAQNCCNNEQSAYFIQPVIQERAWTSPIWYTPPRAASAEASAASPRSAAK